VRIGRSLAIALLATMMLPCCGCGFKPHAFRNIRHPEPLVRAQAVGQGQQEPDSQVVPALVSRLSDEDPVVRLAANEELRQRTGRDFGFVPWANAQDRAAAIARWRSWLTGPPMPVASIQSPELPPLPVESAPPQAARRPARRRRLRAKQPPPSSPAPPVTENGPS
jgi:hypothetical protein